MTRDPFEAAAMALEGSATGGSLGPAGPPVPLEAQARLLGGYVWVERRLFEILGAWVESEPLAEAQIIFDTYSQQHAWHAELFGERLPAADSLDSDWTSRAPSVELDRMLGELAGASSEPTHAARARGEHPSGRRPGGGTLLRLVGLARVVLPRLVAGYALHRRRTGTVSDAPVARSLRFVMHDEIEQWQAVEVLAQTLLRRPNDIAVVTAHQAHLEEFLAERGPGLVPWPTAEERSNVSATSDTGVDLDGSPAPPLSELSVQHEAWIAPAQVSDPSATSVYDRRS